MLKVVCINYEGKCSYERNKSGLPEWLLLTAKDTVAVKLVSAEEQHKIRRKPLLTVAGWQRGFSTRLFLLCPREHCLRFMKDVVNKILRKNVICNKSLIPKTIQKKLFENLFITCEQCPREVNVNLMSCPLCRTRVMLVRPLWHAGLVVCMCEIMHVFYLYENAYELLKWVWFKINTTFALPKIFH